MDIVLIILGIWIIPGLIAYVIGCLHSKQLSFDKNDRILLFPIVNIMVLGLVLIILFDELVINKIWR